MQVSWSLMLNIVLLAGVIVAIVRTLREKRRQAPFTTRQTPWPDQKPGLDDEIIAVRKISTDSTQTNDEKPIRDGRLKVAKPSITATSAVSPTPVVEPPDITPKPAAPITEKPAIPAEPKAKNPVMPMFFLLGKDKKQFAGYDLLQTLLGAGLRFGDGQLFHRHQKKSGHGPVLFSLAAATATGMFDLQNMGMFSVHGLCLFMQSSGHTTIDSERFEIMLQTAKQLSEELDAHLLDDKRQPLSELNLKRYYAMLNLNQVETEVGIV